MNEALREHYARSWRRLRVVCAVLLIGGSAIAFSPVWWGNDWSEASVVAWLRTVFGMALIVWLSVLSGCLWREGHEFHAAMVLGLILPVTSRSTAMAGRGAETVPATFHAIFDRYCWGYPGLAILVALLLLAAISFIGRRSSWRYFSALGPERHPEATSGTQRVDGSTHAAR